MSSVAMVGTLFKRRWADLLLAALAVVSFGWFARQHALYAPQAGLATVALFVDGSAVRRGANELEFSAIRTGQELKNMDSVWVGPGLKATLKVEDGTVLELDERTLVRLKRPFRSASAFGEQVRVLSGTARIVRTDGTTEELRTTNDFNELPNAEEAKKTSVDPARVPREIYPSPGSVIISRAKAESLSVGFIWPQPKTGTLVVTSEKSGAVRYHPFEGVAELKAELSLGERYRWQVLDADRKLLYGPYEFDLRAYDTEEVRKMLKAGPRAPTSIQWQ